jgi:leucyl-tRNA synthetase
MDGAKRFIERVFRIVDDEAFRERLSDENSGELDYSYNFLVKKATADFESLGFNTAIAQMMVFINDCYKAKSIYREYFEGFVKIFSCVCPFVGEEIWNRLGHEDVIAYEPWPTYDESKLVTAKVNLAVSINGKVRGIIEVAPDAPQDEVEALAFENPKVKPWLEGKTIRKLIYVPGRILNVVVG